MTAMERDKPQHEDHVLGYYWEQANQKTREPRRRRRVLKYLRSRWANAKPRPDGLKPFCDLAADVAEQRRDQGDFDAEKFWRRVERSVREGFFDEAFELFSVVEDKRRITSNSPLIRETLRWDDKSWPLLRTLLSESYASIATLTAWAQSQRFGIPSRWHFASEPTIKRSKKEETRAAVLRAATANPISEGELLVAYQQRLSKILEGEGIQARPRTVRSILEEAKRNGRNGRN